MAKFLTHKHGKDVEYKSRVKVIPWLLLEIWKAMNGLCFSDYTEIARQIVDRALMESQECLDQSEKEYQSSARGVFPQPVTIWSPPNPGVLKYNVDASWSPGLDICGVWWILMDEKSCVKWVGINTYPILHSSLEAEVSALMWEIFCVSNLRENKVVFESDSKKLMQTLKKSSSWSRPKTECFRGFILISRKARKPMCWIIHVDFLLLLRHIFISLYDVATYTPVLLDVPNAVAQT